MKALVLAGGMGTRLRPITHSMPKQLVPVANKPVLVHCLTKIRDGGITDIGIIVGDRGPEIRAALGDGSALGVKITYIPQEAPFGLAHCVLIAREFLAEDNFVMYLGDNILTADLRELSADFHANPSAAQLVVTPVPNPGESGVAEITPDGVVLGVVEKPAEPRSNLAMVGVYFFTPAIHEAVRNIKLSWRNEWEITDAIQWLVEQGQPVRAHVYHGFWKDTGRIEDLLECNRMLLETTVTKTRNLGSIDATSTVTGPVWIEEGARVERSRLVGPAIIGAGTVVEDSYVGPFTALGENCVLRKAGIEDSITMDGVSVADVAGIHSSLIGRSAEISLCTGENGRHKLFVGDHTRVEVNA
jgi:glucose-1-phosphate thymidylyltransferase